MTSDLESKVAASIIVEIFKETIIGIKCFDVWIRNKTKGYDPLGIAAKRYVQKINDRYNSIRIFGMSQPISLRDIFVRVNILEKRSIYHSLSIDELEKAYSKDRNGFGVIIKTKDGFDVLNEIDKVMVFGKPGAGKTTFLKSLLLSCIDGDFNRKLIPIFISLKDYSDSNKSLKDFIVDEFSICNFPDADAFVEKGLFNGAFMILLDGYDEVTNNLDYITSHIKNFIHKYSKNKFVLSCRIAARDYIFDNFTEVEISDFDKTQIYRFIRNWFGINSQKSEDCIKNIENDSSICELATVPLLLTLLCVTYNEILDFPKNRSELYFEATSALLKKWDASRGIKRDVIYKSLSLRRKDDLLGFIAYNTFVKDQYFIKKNIVIDLIDEYVENIRDKNTEIDSEIILKSIEAQHGLIVERSFNIYSFSHLTFQEYFCSKYIVSHETEITFAKIIDSHLLENKWREVVILISEQLAEADRYFLQIINRINQLPKEFPALNKFISLIDNNLEFAHTFEWYSIWIYIIIVLKEHFVEIQQFERAAYMRDAQETFKNKISDIDNSKYEYGKFKIDELDYSRYHYAFNILVTCLRSDCYITKEMNAIIKKQISSSILSKVLNTIEPIAISKYSISRDSMYI